MYVRYNTRTPVLDMWGEHWGGGGVWSSGPMDKALASQPRDSGFKPHLGHGHVSLYDTSTSLFNDVNTARVILKKSSELA